MSKPSGRSFLRRGGRSAEEQAAVDALRAAARGIEANITTTIPHLHTLAHAQQVAARADVAMLRLRHGQVKPSTLSEGIVLGLQVLAEWRALLADGWNSFDRNAPPWAQRHVAATAKATGPEDNMGNGDAISLSHARGSVRKAGPRREKA